jgi:Core-2/I-Branching enzyme
MKIAFCFLLTFSFPTEKVWEKFFERVNTHDYYIVIHGKPQLVLETDLFKDHSHILDSIPTKWGDISLVKATILMLRHATEVLDVDFCCILSGNCIPVKDFDHIREDLIFLPISRLCLLESYHPILRYKQSQWCTLSLEHIQIILKHLDKYLRYFEDIKFTEINTIAGAPDEYFFITLLLGQNIHNFLKNGCTYVNFDSMLHMGHPKTYAVIKRRKLNELEESHFFFMRKIQKDTVIKEINGSTRSIEEYEPCKPIIVCAEFEMKIFSKSI